jgi:oligopeptide transport system permease protein
MYRCALTTLFLLTLCAIFGPMISSYTYDEIHLALKNTPPSTLFWFGSDELGRDVFTRVCWGARISLSIGIFAALIDAIIGVLFGTFAAYLGKTVDAWMMRLCDILASIPYLLVVILLTVIRGSGFMTLLLAMTCTGWIHMARITRSQMQQIQERDFVLAARSMQASHARILFVHLIPNAIGPILATMTLTIPTAIFTEAFLSFVGLGIQAPAASWGGMINDSLSAMRYYPWRLFFPSLMITLTMLSFNILGNHLRDRFDPRLRRCITS